MDAKNFGKNLEKVRKFLLKGDDEIDEKLFEELKKTTSDENEEGALRCIECKKLYPEEFAREFHGKCAACAEKEFSEKLTKIVKGAFAVAMVFLIVVAANYLLIRPLLGEKIAPLAEHKIFGNLFKNQFIYYVFEAFSIIYIVTSYFKARGSKEDQRVVAATAVMLSVGLLLTALLFKGKGLMIADFALLFVLLALAFAVAWRQRAEWEKVRAFKFASVELNAKMLKTEVKTDVSEDKTRNAAILKIKTDAAATAKEAAKESKKHYGELVLAEGCAAREDKKFIFDDYAEFSKGCDEALSDTEYPKFDDVAAGEAI